MENDVVRLLSAIAKSDGKPSVIDRWFKRHKANVSTLSSREKRSIANRLEHQAAVMAEAVRAAGILAEVPSKT